jgi:hypothetical protein
MELPYSNTLPINSLVRVFFSTTNSYKFYWFAAILAKIKQGDFKFNISDLILEMIVEAWYPINRFKLSFGKQDSLYEYVLEIKTKFNYGADLDRNELKLALHYNRDQKPIKDAIKVLKRYVPTRFLTPWFEKWLRGINDHKKDATIRNLTRTNFSEKPLYYFSENSKEIVIFDDWHYYLYKNAGIIEGFVFWHLTNYLQKNNPNTPNISHKLFSPENRDLSKARKFWSIYLSKEINPTCIYSGIKLSSKDICIDHFIPWSFVTHDQLWNLVPTTKEVNSSKRDSLPSLSYLNEFSKLQFFAFHKLIYYPKLLDDYLILFESSLNEIQSISEENFQKHIEKTVKPVMEVAKIMGFPAGWTYYDL